MAILGMIPLDLDTTVLDIFDTLVSSGGSAVITASASRSGANTIRLGFSAVVTKTLAAALTTVYVAGAYAPSSVTTSGTNGGLAFWDTSTATPQVSLKFNPDGSIAAYRGTTGSGTLLGTSAPGAIAVAVYQHIEATVTISATVGVVQVWVNSVSVLNLTGQNTKATSNTTVSGVWWGAGYTVGTADWCDLIWADARINDRRVECVLPTGAGNYAQFTPSTGSNWQNVDEVPPTADTDYNESSTVNHIDSFAHGALTGVPTTIDAVEVFVRARNTTAGASSVAPFVRSSTTDSVGTALSLNTSYQTFGSVFLTNPATGSAWANAAAVNAAEFGYKKTV